MANSITNLYKSEGDRIVQSIYSYRDVVEFMDLIRITRANFTMDGTIPMKEELGGNGVNTFHTKVRLYEKGILYLSGKFSTLTTNGLILADSWGDYSRDELIQKLKAAGGFYYKANFTYSHPEDVRKIVQLDSRPWLTYGYEKRLGDFELKLIYETKGKILDQFGDDNRVIVDLSKHKNDDL